jgi:hypothetical protein
MIDDLKPMRLSWFVSSVFSLSSCVNRSELLIKLESVPPIPFALLLVVDSTVSEFDENKLRIDHRTKKNVHQSMSPENFVSEDELNRCNLCINGRATRREKCLFNAISFEPCGIVVVTWSTNWTCTKRISNQFSRDLCRSFSSFALALAAGNAMLACFTMKLCLFHLRKRTLWLVSILHHEDGEKMIL